MGSCGVGVLLLVMIGAVTPDTRHAFNRRPLQRPWKCWSASAMVDKKGYF